MIKIINKPGNYKFTLNKPGQELKIVGRFKLDSTDIKHWHVEIIHAAPNTTSRTNIRGVVAGRARAHVSGLVKVLKSAVGTQAFLEERILLLSQNAKAEAVPNLEIETDDVSCSHAATVGSIDPQQMFYLQSRGISPEAAKKLIIDGFLKV